MTTNNIGFSLTKVNPVYFRMSLLTFYLISTVNSQISSDCPNVVNLAFTLNFGDQWAFIMDALQVDCCGSDYFSTYIICDEDSRVIQLDWDDADFDGFINGSAIPDKLTILKLQNNYLTGSLPSLPIGLTYLDVSSNFLAGPLPSLPTGICSFYVNDNFFIGDVPYLPDALTELSLGHSSAANTNHFTGSVFLYQPKVLYINNNWITDIVVQDASELTECDISNNPLSGNLHLTNLGATVCTRTGLYSANLLPKTLPTSALNSRLSSTLVKTTLKTVDTTTTTMSVRNSFDTSRSLYISTTTHQVALTTTATENSGVSILINSLTMLPVISKMNSISTEYDTTTLGLSSTITVPTIVTGQDANVQDASTTNPSLIYGLAGALMGLCILVLVASLVFKHPKMHSKYGRKNSFGTLNTVATGKTN